MRVGEAGRLGRIAGAVIGAGLLTVALLRIGWADVSAALGRVSVAAVVASVLLNVPITLLRALRTRALLGSTQPRVPIGQLCESQLVGQTLSAVTPAATGDLWRAVMWQRVAGTSLPWGSLVVVTERIVGLMLLLGVGLALVAPAAGGPAVSATLILVAVVIAASPWIGLVVLVRFDRPRRLIGAALRRTPLRGRIEGIRRVSQSMATALLAPAVVLPVVAASLAVFALGGLQILLLTDGLGGHVDLTGATAAACLSQGLGSLSALPFGLGVGDVSAIGVLSRMGTTSAIAAGTAILVRLTVTLPVTALAALVLAVRSHASPGILHLRGRVAAPEESASTVAGDRSS